MSQSQSISPEQLQQVFKQYLMQGNPGIREHISKQGVLTQGFRLNIYAHAYVARLVEALAADFEALSALLGEQQFYELGRDYIQAHPSTNTSLRWFGKKMASFLKRTNPYCQQPYLYEIAAFEWALVDAFNAAAAEPINLEHMAGLAPEKWPGLVLQFHSSVTLCEYEWNILPIWQAMRAEQLLPETAHTGAKQQCLVWRRDLRTGFRTLEADEALLLPMALKGKDFSQLCEFLMTQPGGEADTVALRAASCLKSWIADGLVIDLHT